MIASPLMERIERVIVVVGCQRSGTTLTGQILGAHPTALLLDEFDGLYPWFHALATGDALDGAAIDDLLIKAGAKYRDDDSRLRFEGGSVRLSPRVSVLVLKAPNLTYDEDKLARLHLPVTIVYPVRDPRAVVASMTKLDHIDFVGNQLRLMRERPKAIALYEAEYASMADERAPLWRRQAVLWRVKSGRRAAFEAAGLPVHAFAYEDLASEPVAVIGPMLDACGLDDPQRARAAHTVYAGLGPGGSDRTRPIDARSLHGWRDALDPAQQADVLSLAQPLAGRLGYG